MNINEEKLAVVVKQFKKVFGSHQLSSWEPDDLNTVIQEILGAEVETPFELPVGSEVVAYFLRDEGEDGFIFAMRPSVWSNHPHISAQVAGLYQEARDFEPRDKDSNSLWDGGKISAKEIVRQVAENVARELDALVPAYEKLFKVEES